MRHFFALCSMGGCTVVSKQEAAENEMQGLGLKPEILLQLDDQCAPVAASQELGCLLCTEAHVSVKQPR